MRTVVGRDSERDAVERAFEQVASGRGSALAFAGPPGIGKTTLLDLAVNGARRRRWPAAWGVAWDDAGAPVYWPLIQALRGLAARVPAAAAQALLEGAALLGSAPRLDGHDREDARIHLYARSVEALAGLRRPTLLAFDDLHAADTASLELLAFWLRSTRGTPLLWTLTWRDGEAAPRAPAALRALMVLGREVEVITVQPLGVAQIEQLAELEGDPLEPRQVEALLARTLGNPLFVVELLRHGAHGKLPEGVRQLWAPRLERLPADEREALEAAAILGDELALPALAAVLGIGPEAAMARLAGAVTGAFIIDEGSTRVRFTHPLAREAVLAAVDVARREALHRRAADALAAIQRGGQAVAASIIAHHHLAAGAATDPEGLFAAVRDAAADASQVGADDDAAQLLGRAVEALDALGAPVALRRDALILATEALQRVGRRGDSVIAAERAVELSRQLGDPEGLARAALARGLELRAGVIDPVLVRTLEEADALLPAAPSTLRARVMSRLAAARQPAADPAGPIDMALDAVAMAEQAASPRDLAIVLFNAGSALAEFAHPLQRVSINQRAFDAAEAVGERAFAIRAAARMMFDHLELGDLWVAQRWLATLGACVEQVRGSRWRWLPLAGQAMMAHLRGDIRGALAINQELAVVARQLDDGAAVRAALIQRGGLLRDGGTAEEREVAAALFAAESRPGANHRVVRVVSAAARAAHDDANATRIELGDLTFDAAQDTRPASLLMWADIAAATRDPDLARALRPHVERCDRAWCSWGLVGFFFDGPTERALGLALWTEGRSAEAVTVFERAADSCRARGMRAAHARLLFERARALATVPGSSSHVAEALSRARDEATALGMVGLLTRLDRIEPADASPTSAPASPAVPPSPPPLLERRGAIWCLFHDGHAHHLKDQKGLGMLARLLELPGRELHALDLMGVDQTPDAGDSGEQLDEEAKLAYRSRLQELERDLHQAELDGDHAAKEILLEERDALARELARGFGLGGRARRAGAAAERARVNVQRRVKDAIRKISEVEPELARQLEDRVVTGLFCSYRPDR